MSVLRSLYGWTFPVWLVLVFSGFGWLWRHALTPGPSGIAPAIWPAQSHIHPASGRATLLIVAHPHCPCTRATLNQLARLMARTRSRITTYVVFFKPGNAPRGWEVTDTYQRASEIPGVHVVSDLNGTEAHLFGAATSGQALLYDAGGKLLFKGGLTPGRGHEGDNAGQAAILHIVSHQATSVHDSPVYGCALFTTQFL